MLTKSVRKHVWQQAREAGLLGNRSLYVDVTVSPRLVEIAKQNAGLASDQKLVEDALANLVVRFCGEPAQ